MAGVGDYRHFQVINSNKTMSRTILAATDYSTANALITAKSANHQIFVQKIEISITTYAAKVWTFQDSAGTPVEIGKISIAAAIEAHVSESGTIILDFGPGGLPLTLGKNLDMKMDSAGAAGQVHVEAYERLGATIDYLRGASLQ